MNILKLGLVLFLVFFVSIESNDPDELSAEDNPENLLPILTQNINFFSADFNVVISTLEEYADKNLITSPMSAHMVLSMLSLGAEGNTLAELNNGLYQFHTSEFTKNAYRKEMDMLNGLQKHILMTANKVYVKEGTEFELAPTFKKDVAEVFYSEVENIDFTQGTLAAAKINAWVEEKTKETIKNFMDPRDLTSDTALVLVNTIYFKGEWKSKFDPSKTMKAKFGVDKTTVDMMHQMSMFNYGESNDLDAKLGMVSMFTDMAELGGLLITPSPLKVTKAIQKAFIDVNEKGVTAGAASAVVSGILSSQIKKQFSVDHPFLFEIYKDRQKMFSGKFTNKE